MLKFIYTKLSSLLRQYLRGNLFSWFLDHIVFEIAHYISNVITRREEKKKARALEALQELKLLEERV